MMAHGLLYCWVAFSCAFVLQLQKQHTNRLPSHDCPSSTSMFPPLVQRLEDLSQNSTSPPNYFLPSDSNIGPPEPNLFPTWHTHSPLAKMTPKHHHHLSSRLPLIWYNSLQLSMVYPFMPLQPNYRTAKYPYYDSLGPLAPSIWQTPQTTFHTFTFVWMMELGVSSTPYAWCEYLVSLVTVINQSAHHNVIVSRHLRERPVFVGAVFFRFGNPS